MNKIFWSIFYIIIGFIGFNGLIINYYSQTKHEISITDIDLEQIKKYNTIILKEAVGIDLLYYSYSDDNSYLEIIYPLLSASEFNELNNDNNFTVKTFVKRKNYNLRCFETTCLPTSLIDYSGICYKVSSEFNSDIINDYKINGIVVHKDAIIIDETEEVRNICINLIMFLCLFISLSIVKSFFIKAHSFNEWFNKVTHKDETKNVIS